jgi:hypothetical protein
MYNQKPTQFMNRSHRRIALALIVLAAFALALGLDIVNRGPAWHIAWSLTGEESPVAQVRGMLGWMMSQARTPLSTEPLAPIDHASVNPYGINTFLHLEADAAKIEEQVRMISEAGFVWLRQPFNWEDIEVDGRGLFTDSRNDMDGDGIADTIDSWLKYDRIVDLAEAYGLRLQVRMDTAPAWASTARQEGTLGAPDDLQDFVNFASAVAERYRGRIHHYQIWNEPNLAFEWGGFPADPERYTDMLCRTYTALKAIDPEIVVISAPLAPTVSLNSTDLNDFIFLQRMYNAGAAPCFDIMSVQGYGLFSGPTDQRMRPTTVNIARNLYIRDMMVANGDAHKAIWISEAAWNFTPTYAEVPLNADGSDPIIQRTTFGQVTMQQAADYITAFYDRAEQEWPWVGVINYWYFTRPSDLERSQAFYYFRMVEPDYSEDKPTFTPLPIYNALRDHIAAHQPRLYTGTHQAENYAIDAGEDAALTDAEGAHFGQALTTSSIAFSARGTDAVIRWRGDLPAHEIRVFWGSSADDMLELRGGFGGLRDPSIPDSDGWRETSLGELFGAGPSTWFFRIESDQPVEFDSVLVADRRFEKLYPLFVVVVVAVGSVVAVAVAALRGLRR